MLNCTYLQITGSSSVSKPAAVIPELDVVAVERKDRDEFLILASDGLWGAVSTESACAMVRRRLGEKTSRITFAVGGTGGRRCLADRARQGARREGGARRQPGQRQRRHRLVQRLLGAVLVRAN